MSQFMMVPSNVPTEVSAGGNTGVPVYIQDQTTPLLTVPFLQVRASLALSADALIGSRTIDLVAGHGVIAGEVIEIANLADGRFMQSAVVSVNVNEILLDQPCNITYTVSDAVVRSSSQELNTNGAITPQIFSILPLPSQRGDIVRLLIDIRDDDDMDFTTFGGIPRLINGCVVRVRNSDGTFKNLFNIKDNGDWINEGFNHQFLPNNGGGDRGFSAMIEWGGQENHGVVVRLEGSLDEELQIIIQDDLTDLTRFHLRAQGSEIQD